MRPSRPRLPARSGRVLDTHQTPHLPPAAQRATLAGMATTKSIAAHYRHRRCAQLLALGLSLPTIADMLGVSTKTAREYVYRRDVRAWADALIAEADRRIVSLRFVRLAGQLSGQRADPESLEQELWPVADSRADSSPCSCPLCPRAARCQDAGGAPGATGHQVSKE